MNLIDENERVLNYIFKIPDICFLCPSCQQGAMPTSYPSLPEIANDSPPIITQEERNDERSIPNVTFNDDEIIETSGGHCNTELIGINRKEQ